LVQRRGDSWIWNPAAFDAEGKVLDGRLPLQGPRTENCAQCHGIAGDEMDRPVSFSRLGPGAWQTLTRGEVVSPQRISESGVNLVDKSSLHRSWDVHAERLLECSNCHFSVNNPIYRSESKETQPEGLVFDSRRMPLGAYLQRPSHNFAGQSEFTGQTRPAERLTCESCHDPGPTHTWLPYAERHMNAVSCEVCHTPMLHSVSVESVDWTRLDEGGEPDVTWRGCSAGCETAATDLVEGVEPALLLRREEDGRTRLAPYNLVTSWYWVEGRGGKPVDLDLVRRASEDVGGGPADAGGERPEYAADEDRGSPVEDVAEAIRTRLAGLGVRSPTIKGEIQPYPIHHSVATGEWATRDCQACHDESSRLGRPVVLGARPPGGVIPELKEGAGAELTGSVALTAGGDLVYAPRTSRAGLYVLGHDYVRWANLLGIAAILATLVGVAVHGFLRWRTSRDRPAGLPEEGGKTVYMYTTYERIWHWLQALAILLLLLTGIEIHVTRVGLLDFALAVRIHNVLGFLVLANAVFAAFFHLASGQIQHYLPRPGGFFGQAITQARFYLGGIFRGEPHPFQKRPDRKLNPLQQVTYLVILNLLLPLQIVTGILIWGAQRWPAVDGVLGGLTFLAPLHAFGAWMFAAFLLMHVYLTTTGPTPTANIQAMIIGWESMETVEGDRETV
jgi:thiosulfate reductase cytochrome b subunit